MSTTGLDVFDTTLQKTHLWLKDIMQELHTDSRQQAYSVLRATLHTLRDRMTVEGAVKLGAQLPMLIRGMYYEGWTMAGKPVKERHTEEFLAHMREHFRNDGDLDAARAVRAVFKVLGRRVSKGEIKDIGPLLPKDLRAFWSEAVGIT
jgi:uncharacterized protein (DUF2267 family)